MVSKQEPGDDPRDLPPPELYGELLEELGHAVLESEIIEECEIEIQGETVSLQVSIARSKYPKPEESPPKLDVSGPFPTITFFSTAPKHRLSIDGESIEFNGVEIAFGTGFTTLHVAGACFWLGPDADRSNPQFLDGSAYCSAG